MLLAAEFGVGQVLWSMLWFFLFFLWIMLLFHVFGDLFRDKELSGLSKVLWILFLVFFPYLGVFVYLIARGQKMAENQVAAVQAADGQMRSYIQDAAGSSPADQLARAAQLKADGHIDEADYQALKAKILS